MSTRIPAHESEDGQDRLPWLAPAADSDSTESVRGKVVALLVGVVAALSLLGAGLWAMARFNAVDAPKADGAVIPSPGPYKVKPADPGGMKVEGQGDAAYAASDGSDANGQIDFDAVPEQPVTAKPPSPAPSPVPAAPTGVQPVAPAQVQAQARSTPATPPAAAAPDGGVQVQLGAYASDAKAKEGWTRMSTRFSWLGAMTHTIQKGEGPSGPVYRLRVTAGTDAKSVCQRLKVAGEACMIVN